VTAAGVEREPRASVARRLMDPEAIERDDPAWAARQARRHDGVQGPGAWKRLMVAIREEIVHGPLPTPEQLRRARLPILLACGDRDPWLPLEQSVALRRQLPDARLFVAPGVGHVVVAERPAAFNTVLLQFLRATSEPVPTPAPPAPASAPPAPPTAPPAPPSAPPTAPPTDGLASGT
jgi:pimeloyl-ACP methyl ester carboxylesterase